MRYVVFNISGCGFKKFFVVFKSLLKFKVIVVMNNEWMEFDEEVVGVWIDFNLFSMLFKLFFFFIVY